MLRIYILTYTICKHTVPSINLEKHVGDPNALPVSTQSPISMEVAAAAVDLKGFTEIDHDIRM